MGEEINRKGIYETKMRKMKESFRLKWKSKPIYKQNV